jgi:hypothetical protein
MAAYRRLSIIFLISVTTLSAVDIRVDSEYDFFLDDGQTLSKVRIIESGPVTIKAQVGGLAEQVNIPRKAIRSAKLLVKKPFFSSWEVGVYGDFHLAQGDLTLLTKFFPMAAANFTAHLRKRNKYIWVNALNAEVNYLYATDGERRLQMAGFAAGPRWYFQGPQFGWVVGAGGGMATLFLNSYNFTRTSIAGLFFLESGITKDASKSIRLYVMFRVNYWLDSQAVLVSTGIRIGVGYIW